MMELTQNNYKTTNKFVFPMKYLATLKTKGKFFKFSRVSPVNF